MTTEHFRVWADGTVQPVSDGEPYTHQSDDFAVVRAACEDDAALIYEMRCLLLCALPLLNLYYIPTEPNHKKNLLDNIRDAIRRTT